MSEFRRTVFMFALEVHFTSEPSPSFAGPLVLSGPLPPGISPPVGVTQGEAILKRLPENTRISALPANTGKGNNRRWQALADSEGNERIPPDGFDMFALKKVHFADAVSAERCGHRPLLFLFCTLFHHKKHPPTGECFETCAIVVSLSDQTGAFDTLGEILLEECVHNQNRQNRDQAASFHPDDLLSGADICVIEQLLGKQGAQVLQHQGNGLIP